MLNCKRPSVAPSVRGVLVPSPVIIATPRAPALAVRAPVRVRGETPPEIEPEGLPVVWSGSAVPQRSASVPAHLGGSGKSVLRVAMVGNHRKSLLFKARVGSTLTSWSDLEITSITSSKVPLCYRALVLLVDFSDLGWVSVKTSLLVVEHYNPLIPVYVVWVGTPPQEPGVEVTAPEVIRGLCREVKTAYEIISEAEFMPSMRRLSVMRGSRRPRGLDANLAASC